jgi:predicted small secreted protein
MKLIDSFINYLFILSFLVGLFFFPCFSVMWIKAVRKRKIPKQLLISSIILGCVFTGSIITIALLSSKLTSYSREEVLDFVNDSTKYEIRINGSAISNPDLYIKELRKLQVNAPNHSHPTTSVQINVIKTGDELKLILRQDSAIKEEFWVFYPEFRHTTENEIGRIRTKLFKELLIRSDYK